MMPVHDDDDVYYCRYTRSRRVVLVLLVWTRHVPSVPKFNTVVNTVVAAFGLKLLLGIPILLNLRYQSSNTPVLYYQT